MDEKKIASQVSIASIIINILLSAFKLFAGIISKSGAMISDAIHSASDVFSTIIVIIGINISTKDADRTHPYGHDRFECVASILLAVLLFITGLGIGIDGIKVIVSGDYTSLAIPGFLALIAAVVSIIVKEAMYWFTRSAAKKISSTALMADAWHHRSDALSSIGAFIGIFGARMGFPILDSIASVVICGCILKVSVDIFIDAINKTVDRACDEQTVESMRSVVMSQAEVKGIDLLMTRQFGSGIYVDIEISADGSLTLKEAHSIAESVHHAIEKNFPAVKHCMVHVNPFSGPPEE